MTAIQLGTQPCPDCSGHGWVRASGEWAMCESCFGSGDAGTDMPEVLTSSGRIARNVVWRMPPKPKPRMGPA